jgi:hypothetical protein
MNPNVTKLKEWFAGLGGADQEAVLRFLYGKRFVKQEVVVGSKKSFYAGPAPGLIDINEGLYAGPAPEAPATCGQCGRPL